MYEEHYFSNFGSLKSTETAGTQAARAGGMDFSNFGSLKSTETRDYEGRRWGPNYFSNFGSLKSTETGLGAAVVGGADPDFSNFGSLKSTETPARRAIYWVEVQISAISAR